MKTELTLHSFHFGRKWTATSSWRKGCSVATAFQNIVMPVSLKNLGKKIHKGEYKCRREGKGTFMSLGRYSTVFQTEVMALLSYAQILEVLNTEGRDISMGSDRQKVLKALPVPTIHSRLISECKKALRRH